jgi:hypothetical protein
MSTLSNVFFVIFFFSRMRVVNSLQISNVALIQQNISQVYFNIVYIAVMLVLVHIIFYTSVLTFILFIYFSFRATFYSDHAQATVTVYRTSVVLCDLDSRCASRSRLMATTATTGH